VKIAIATDDGRTVSMHFGRAAHYAVLTVENGVVTARELRDKFSPHGTAAGAHQESGNEPHGTGPESHARQDMFSASFWD
jgi:predicted Fe-Mo cluster-binding NifX family protein